MGEREDKDKIKEMLEGHNKKFTATELIVGIVVILLIGCGIGYAIFKLISPPSTQQTNEYTQIQKEINIPPPVTPGNKTTSKQLTPMKPSKKSTLIQQEKKSPQQIASIGNKTLSSTGIVKSENKTQIQVQEISPPRKKTKTNVTGPQIINPYAVSKKGIKKTKKKLTAKHPKYKRELTRHFYKRFLIQVSSNENRKLAILTVLKLRKCGHKAFSKEVKVKGKIFTRVLVGPINSYYMAKDEAEIIKRQLKLKYMPIIRRYDKVP